MSNQPNPGAMARVSYILAIVSVVILLVAFVLGLPFLKPFNALSRIVWLALPTSAVGAFLAYAARQEATHTALAEADREKLRLAWRVNLAMLALMLVLSLLGILLAFLAGGRG